MNIISSEIKINLILLFFLVSVSSFAQPCTGIFDPLDYGAKADGVTLDTKAIQNAIDDCHKNGGGKVYLHKGIFISGTIILKNNVTLYIEAGATLKGSNNLEDFPVMPSRYPSYEGNLETNKMLIYAEDAKYISITGRGIIDGNGDHWVDGPYGFPSFSKRPRIIHFRGCENILVRDITLYNSASWVQSYQSCKNIVIEGITVDSRENKDIEKERYADVPGRNTDGLDLVDCQQVRISNCYINSGDDAICLKSNKIPEGLTGLYTLWENNWDNDYRNAPHNIIRDFIYNNPNNTAWYDSSAVKYPSQFQQNQVWRWYPWPSKITTPGNHPDNLFENKDELTLKSSAGSTYRDMYLLRLAETYLLRAEAFWAKGEMQNAADDINKVRTRSNAKPVEPADVTLDYILDERARELVYEEQRRITLHRTGKLIERVRKYNELNSDDIRDHHALWPIPYSEIEANKDAVIEQNPGYN